MVGVDDLGRVIILISVLDELGFVHRIGRSFPPVLLDGFNLDDYVLAIIPDRHDNAITNSKRIVIGAVIIYRRSVGERYTAEHVDSLVSIHQRICGFFGFQTLTFFFCPFASHFFIMAALFFSTLPERFFTFATFCFPLFLTQLFFCLVSFSLFDLQSCGKILFSLKVI